MSEKTNILGGFALFFIVIFCQQSSVSSHGRLIQPPGRSSAWRYQFKTPHNYNDHELYCGGFSVQWGKNNGKCGICGDDYGLKRPRPNENTGTYGRGVIVEKYKRGQKIEIGIELTASHMGFFEFRICAHNAPNLPENEDCFKYLLEKADGDGTRYYPAESKKYFLAFHLPKHLTCTQCVLQWRYVAGNNWGDCGNGTGKVGCGRQEEFRSCADIKIVDDDGTADDTPSARFPEVPEDNEIGGKSPQHDKSGQAVALSLAFVFVLLLFLFLFIYYLWKKGTLKKFSNKGTKANWASKIMPTLSLPSLKKPKTLPTIKTYGGQSETAPVAPQRRNRPSRITNKEPITPAGTATITPIRRPILSISSPTRVSINGIQVNPNSAELYVPDTRDDDLK